jgi:tetratricopeptide (TPR) repeat protein
MNRLERIRIQDMASRGVFLAFCTLIGAYFIGCNPSQPTSSSSVPAPAEVQVTQQDLPSQSERSFESRFAEGVEKFDRGEIEEAWSIVKELTVLRPKDPELIFWSARVLAARNDIPGAIRLIAQIPDGSPQAAPAAGQAAEWLVLQGDLPAAETRLLGLLKEYPNAIPGLRLLARIYNAQGRRWEARRPLERLIRLGDFTSGELLATVDYREFFGDEAVFATFRTALPENPYVRFSAIRAKLLRNGYGTFIDELLEISRANPALIEPWVWTATSLLELERLEELSAWLQQPPQGADKHPEYLYALGGLMLRTGQREQAARCFAECIRVDRRHVAAYQGLAEAMLEMQKVEAAQQVRQFGNELVTINDLVQQITYQYGEPKLYGVVADMYAALGDDLAAFGWRAIGVTLGHLEMTDELKALQQSLRQGNLRGPVALEGVPYEAWQLPTPPARRTESDSPAVAEAAGGTEIRMEDVAARMGVVGSYDNGAEPNRGWYTIEGLGGGVAALDFDKDGWPDLAFSQAGASPLEEAPEYEPKMLYRSLGGSAFREVAFESGFADRGYGQGIGSCDIDQDGFPDLLVANLGEARIYRNQGDGTFECLIVPHADSNSPWNTAIQAADIDGDHLPDLLSSSYIYGNDAISRWCEIPNTVRGSCNPKTFPPGKNRILFNQGDWTWRMADQELLESVQAGYTLGSLVTNLDGLEGNDVFFANDVSPNAFLLSVKDSETGQRVLVERAAAAGVAVDPIGQAQACMGIACGDQNRDGLLDLIVTNYYNEPSTLYLQTLPGIFVDGTRRSKLGVATLEQLSFGSQLADLDNDGWLDFAAVNGHIDDLRHDNIPWHMPTQILKNEKGQFRWLRDPSPGPYFDGKWIGRGLSMLDYNRDGKPDLVATHIDRPAALLENTTRTEHHFLQLELVGTLSERDATGARIRIECEGEFWVSAMNVGEGYFGSNERLIHVGIGSHAHVDRVMVNWPSGESDVWEHLEANRRYRLIEKVGLTEVD